MAAIRYFSWLSIALLGCGRVGFDASVDAAAVADVAPDAPLVPLCDRFPTAIYCSEFEGGDLAGAAGVGAVAVAGGGWLGTDAYSVTAGPGQTPLLGFDLPAIVSAGELHIGGRLFLSAGPPSAAYVVVAQAISPTFKKVSFDFTTSDRAQLVNTISNAGGLTAGANSFPRALWACFELAIIVAPVGGGGRVEVLIDGVSALAGFDNVATSPADGFSRIELAAISSPSNTATETIVFDNWIVATEAIGCP